MYKLKIIRKRWQFVKEDSEGTMTGWMPNLARKLINAVLMAKHYELEFKRWSICS